MNRSVITALVIATAATGWILSGQIGSSREPPAAEPARPAPATAAPLQPVRVQTFAARDYTTRTVLTGRTRAERRVELRAETAGPIAKVLAPEGAVLKEGDRIAQIALREREAQLAEARAWVAQRRSEYEAAQKLAEKGFRSQLQLATDKAELDQALARLKQIETDAAATTIRAPFDGVLEQRAVEVGTFVQRGDAIATIVDLDPILFVGEATETEVGALRVGTTAQVRLITGEAVQATVRYVAATANADTRTFRVELEAPNRDRRIREGLTAEITLPGRTVRAHLVSPALLTLADNGQVGVKLVTAGNVVRFAPVQILGEAPEGSWLGGLPEQAILVVVGQEFVKDGERVEPVAAAEAGS